MNLQSLKINEMFRTVLVLLAWGGFFWLAVSSFQYKNEMNLQNFEVVIINKENDLHLLEAAQIHQYVEAWLPDSINRIKLSEFQMAALQEHIMFHPYVKSGNLYIGKNGRVKIECIPRYPVARVVPARGDSYLIDHFGEIMPISDNLIIKLPVIRGRVPQFNSADEADLNRLAGLGMLFKEINRIEFLQVLIDQVVVTALGDYRLLPVMGTEIIEFGELERIEEKLMDLDEFYNQVIAQVGWNQYESINLKYEGQVVGKKKASTNP
nr:cell division protein FtsQ/DivIB [Saprospiraceae bacterium]